MNVLAGLDLLERSGFARLRGKSVAVLCNQASITRGAIHILDAMLPSHAKGHFRIAAVFGPQHGIWGHTQDNMIEWEGYRDPRTGLRFHSLYGETREPRPEMLEGVELLVVDLPDIGSRYYTFAWTMALCFKRCGQMGIPVLVLDRPNPIGGVAAEGTVLKAGFESFVGLYPLPTRHAMTLGEVATHLNRAHYPKATVEIARCEGWSRADHFEATGLTWAMPSPNMPRVDTALVYPGMCLLEGTRLSEGRGTTRPFETFGAPFIDGWKLSEALNNLRLPGVWFRPVQFQPTFQKHEGTLCEGAFVHVRDRSSFEPVTTAIAILQEVVRRNESRFEWLPPPYEYEREKMPIDILAGNRWLRPAVEGLEPLASIRERMRAECAAFEPQRKEALLYA